MSIVLNEESYNSYFKVGHIKIGTNTSIKIHGSLDNSQDEMGDSFIVPDDRPNVMNKL